MIYETEVLLLNFKVEFPKRYLNYYFCAFLFVFSLKVSFSKRERFSVEFVFKNEFYRDGYFHPVFEKKPVERNNYSIFSQQQQ